MSGSQDEIPLPPPPPSSSQTPTLQTPHTVSTIKLPILKRGEYNIWAMKMEHYLAHTDYPIREVIQNRNGPVSITIDTQGQIKVLPPRTAEEILARERERKARTTLLMALPEDHLAKFHKMTDAKEMWDAIKSRFGGNDESKKMTKPGVDSLSFDDLYNNLRVFENDVKGSTASSSSTQNVAFVSENTSNTNDVSTAYSVSNTSGQNSQNQLVLIKPKLSATIATRQAILLESVEPREIKIVGGEMLRTLAIRMGEYLREQLSDANIEIKAYTKGLKKVEAQLVSHQQGQLWYEEKIRYDGILSYENEVLQSVFMNKESELEKQLLYDRFVTAGGMHVVPPLMTGNYMPSGPDVEIDYSQFTYGPNQSQPSESETQTSNFDTCKSACSDETHESLPEPTENKPKVVNQPKVWSDAPIIEDYASDSEDEHVSQPTKEQKQPSFASTNKQVKTPRETVKNQFTHSKNPTVDKKGLGYGFTARACFVCGSLSHLIRDCDFHEKRMAKQAELNNSMRMKSSQREIRPIWNNVQRVNHKNQFVPTAAVPTNAAMKVNTVKPIVNRVRPANLVLLGEKGKLLLSPQQVVIGDKKDITGKISPNTIVDQDYPHRTLKHKGIIDSGCSRHMTGNKAYLAAYQDFNGGPVAFGGSKGYITGKGKIKIGKLDFEDVCFVKELQHFNLFSVSQICDKKNKFLFTDSECLVLSIGFKLPDANQVLLRIYNNP
ncbi:hypothetical protein Tco_1113646 [Tanacetum coccineum]|uniref:Retrovirus-related Pol polyprotein from transposon TNT 1-94-like beta-barrel domain-containing protein n=1 Tax=Tanacetum coccineum TaxID=301880 RepID=A0ABQ5ISS5_9ASTR